MITDRPDDGHIVKAVFASLWGLSPLWIRVEVTVGSVQVHGLHFEFTKRVVIHCLLKTRPLLVLPRTLRSWLSRLSL